MSWTDQNASNNKFFLTACLLSAVVLMTLLGIAHSEAIFKVEPFSTAHEGNRVPSGWEPLTFPKIPRHTQYKVVRDGESTVVQATSNAAASGLLSRVKIDLREYPILQWRWKVLNVISKGNVRNKKGDDYAGRIYITFEYDPDKVNFSRKAKYRLGRILFGDIPIAAINYIWDNRAPKGTIVDSAYTDLSKMIVVESGQENVNQWVLEERDVYEDYKKAFGEEPPLVNGIAIMTDTDNTGETAVAYYGDIVFKEAG